MLTVYRVIDKNTHKLYVIGATMRKVNNWLAKNDYKVTDESTQWYGGTRNVFIEVANNIN